jgi:hypothetical protein
MQLLNVRELQIQKNLDSVDLSRWSIGTVINIYKADVRELLATISDLRQRLSEANALVDAAMEKSLCGHPAACIAQTKGGTAYCQWCEEVAALKLAAEHEVELAKRLTG